VATSALKTFSGVIDVQQYNTHTHWWPGVAESPESNLTLFWTKLLWHQCGAWNLFCILVRSAFVVIVFFYQLLLLAHKTRSFFFSRSLLNWFICAKLLQTGIPKFLHPYVAYVTIFTAYKDARKKRRKLRLTKYKTYILLICYSRKVLWKIKNTKIERAYLYIFYFPILNKTTGFWAQRNN